ncbi:DNA-processing protein DprA [Pontitalea aquivivens]|uniref:DNA-processing protein DprA n=1 Tax=Pontitalea aquivivens TaxID=3388663 RepID=UPI003970ADA4
MTEVSHKTRALLALSMLKGVGPAALRRIAALHGFEKLPKDELSSHLPRNIAAGTSSDAWLEASSAADRQIQLAHAAGARVISSADTDYPRLLAETRDDPRILFVKGRLASSPEKSVAIIGTREPTDHGRIIAQRLTGFFVGEGWSVVSGLAIGCDAIAHEAALDAGGHTVAVMAHGLQTVAPSRHKKLAQRIIESGGALVTEYRFGQEPLPTNFVKRDRIQAGLAQGVVMVQSDVTGGSLHASRASIDYGRWLAIPYPTDQDVARLEPKVQGNLLLADGTPQEKTSLLKCDQSGLSRLIVLRSRDDYGRMTRLRDSIVPQQLPPVQGQLF